MVPPAATPWDRSTRRTSPYIVQFDADLSHPPELLPTMIDALKTWPVVIGSRYIAGGEIVPDPTFTTTQSTALSSAEGSVVVPGPATVEGAHWVRLSGNVHAWAMPPGEAKLGGLRTPVSRGDLVRPWLLNLRSHGSRTE